MSSPRTTPADAEAARLRDEVAALRGRLDDRRRRAALRAAARRAAAAVLAPVVALAVVAGTVGLWAAATALDTDRWVRAVAPLPQQPAVAAAVSRYATDQLFDVLDVERRLRAVLPDQAAFAAGPLTSQVRQSVAGTVDKVVGGEAFQRIWVEANRRLHRQAVAVLDGTSTVVTAGDGHVRIDLLPLINQVLRQLSAQMPTLFGRRLSLPDLTSGQIPDNLRRRVEAALGVTLPANFAQFTVYDGGRLRAAQEAVVVLRRSVAGLAAAAVGLLALALLVSPGRRRTLAQLGIWLVLAAVAVTAALRAARGELLAAVPAGTYRDGVAAATSTVTALLRTRGEQLVWLGAGLTVVMYLVGPGRLPTWLRRAVARGGRAVARGTRSAGRALAGRGPAWVRRHLDALRVAGVVAAAAAALLLGSWPALLAVAVLLAGYEAAVTLVGRGARA
ncbi:hypothetical protein GCM10010124_38470 [Pilimelia terevasa]|uniref:Integral membrane protein n=1 Tax=Pilimelia terevasa TaxID=53372 RepID=A0A8J3BV29_9ACTN|nr:hypothetical protein [Pilimelia terevasa]GGK41945.1 hypothetical protein GCM10010124_38470 [Pilimelia terevasa]